MRYKHETNFVGIMLGVLMSFLMVGTSLHFNSGNSLTGAVSGLEEISGFQTQEPAPQHPAVALTGLNSNLQAYLNRYLERDSITEAYYDPDGISQVVEDDREYLIIDSNTLYYKYTGNPTQDMWFVVSATDEGTNTIDIQEDDVPPGVISFQPPSAQAAGQGATPPPGQAPPPAEPTAPEGPEGDLTDAQREALLSQFNALGGDTGDADDLESGTTSDDNSYFVCNGENCKMMQLDSVGLELIRGLEGATIIRGLTEFQLRTINSLDDRVIRRANGELTYVQSTDTDGDTTKTEVVTIGHNANTHTFTTREGGDIVERSSITYGFDANGPTRTVREYRIEEDEDFDENKYEELTTGQYGEPSAVTIIDEDGNRVSAEFREGGCVPVGGSSEETASNAAVGVCNSQHEQWTSRSYFYQFFEAPLTQFRGISYIPTLFINEFVGDDWLKENRERIDKFFAENYLGREYWESYICNQATPAFNLESQGIAFVDTRAGLSSVGAHIEASKSEPLESPEGSGDPVQYLYKVTFNVKNGDFEQDPKAIPEIKFRVEFRGEERNRDLFKGKFTVKNGESKGRIGDRPYVKYSTFVYNEVCLVFDKDKVPFSWSRNVRDREELCNTVAEPKTEPTIFVPLEERSQDEGDPEENDI